MDQIDDFIEILLRSPELTMQAVQVRLAHTDYELVLKKADVLKPFEQQWDKKHSFPFATAQKGGEW
jgi:hypothetical protein